MSDLDLHELEQVDTRVVAWVDDFPRERVAAAIARVENRLAKWRQALAIYDAMHSENGSEPTRWSAAAAAPDPTNSLIPLPERTPTKAQAVTTVMRTSPHTTWKLDDLRRALVAHGWIEDTKRASHGLQVVTSTMVQRGQLERPEKGFYRLPSEGTTDAGRSE
jgi:hypothetical protein